MIFASAPSMSSGYLHNSIEYNPSQQTLRLFDIYTFKMLDGDSTNQHQPFPLCYPRPPPPPPPSSATPGTAPLLHPRPSPPPPRFFPGKWFDRQLALSLKGYGTSSIWKDWEEESCYAEAAVHSCFYQNATNRAEKIARRIWEPQACALINFNAFEFLKRHQSRTIYFVGDSVIGQQYTSLLCLLAGNEVSTNGLHWEDAARTWSIRKNCQDG
jgi:hypothetical protein